MDNSKPKPDRIAIDGPSASGKTTVGKLLATRWHYRFLDTGAMYRCVTHFALQQRIDLDNERALGQLAESLRFELRSRNIGDHAMIVQGLPLSQDLYTDVVTASVSRVSAVAPVRTAMVSQQRGIGAEGRIVMVGRDIGTVVMPDADLKVYLDASPRARATRRMLQYGDAPDPATYDDVLIAIERRDEYDSNRRHSPLTKADDAVCVNTDGLTLEGVVGRIEDLSARAMGVVR